MIAVVLHCVVVVSITPRFRQLVVSRPVDLRIDPPVDLPVDPRIDPRIDLRMTARNINFTAEDSSTLSTAEDPSTPSNGNSSFSSEASSEVGQRADGA